MAPGMSTVTATAAAIITVPPIMAATAALGAAVIRAAATVRATWPRRQHPRHPLPNRAADPDGKRSRPAQGGFFWGFRQLLIEIKKIRTIYAQAVRGKHVG